MNASLRITCLLSVSILIGCGGGAMTAPPTVQTPPPTPHVTHYAVVDLPPLPGGSAAQAEDLNSAGDVAGYSVADYHAHAVIWKNGVPGDLGTLDSFALAVNSSDQVAGYATGDAGTPHAFLWTEQNGAQDLGTLPGFDSSIATGMNDSGVVVGTSFVFSDPNIQQGFQWTSASGMQPVVGAVSALAVNRTGQVAGIDASLHAALFAGGQATDLGTIGQTSVAVAVNSAGRVVGISSTHAFIFDGTMRDLGLRDDWTSAVATGINDSSIVVGYGMTGGTAHPFTWTNAKGLTDINTLISAGSGWNILVATGVNTKGQISGLGQINGELHGVLLNPN